MKLLSEITTDTTEQRELLYKAVRFMMTELSEIQDRLDEMDGIELPNVEKSLRHALMQADLGMTIPIEELWDGIDAE